VPKHESDETNTIPQSSPSYLDICFNEVSRKSDTQTNEKLRLKVGKVKNGIEQQKDLSLIFSLRRATKSSPPQQLDPLQNTQYPIVFEVTIKFIVLLLSSSAKTRYARTQMRAYTNQITA